MHTSAHAQHLFVLHAREVVSRFECQLAVDQHDRQQVLNGDVRHGPVVDNLELLVWHVGDDFVYIVHLKIVFSQHVVEHMHRALNRPTDRPALDGGAQHLVILTEPAHQIFTVEGLGREGVEKITFTGKNVFHTRPACGRHQGRLQTIVCRHAAHGISLFDMFGIAEHGVQPCCLLPGVRQHVANLQRSQAEQGARGRGRTKNLAGGSRMMA